MNNIPKILQSSKDSENVSTTFQGAVILITVMVVNQLGIDITANEITLIVGLLFTILGGIMTLVGLFRKLYYRFNLDR